MARLASLRQDVSRITDGDWITVGATPEEQFRIRTRGQTPRYATLLNQLQREAARRLNRDLPPGSPQYGVNDLPTLESNRCTGRAMAEETFLDVEGLEDETGPVTAERFRQFLRDPEAYGAAIYLTYGAMLRIHEDRQEETVAAVGNSEPASVGT